MKTVLPSSMRHNRRRLILKPLAVIAAMTAGALLPLQTVSAQPSFQGLGDLPGGFYHSVGRGISGNGLTVVGWSYSPADIEAYRWTAAQGMVALGPLAGVGMGMSAESASTDGATLAGNFVHNDLTIESFRWTSAGGYQLLGTLPGDAESHAYGISANGSVVVGASYSAGSVAEAFRWTTSGMVSLGDLPGGATTSTAWAVSANGLIVVGESESDSGGGSDAEAFTWTTGGGMVGLGDLTGGSFHSSARGISADGTVVVGASQSAQGEEAFRWTVGGGMVGLGDLPGGSFFSNALDASADGSVIVGRGSGTVGSQAFVWDEVHGMRNLQTLLANDYGLDLTGWTLMNATAVSDDGLTIIGTGRHPNLDNEAWIARLAETGDGDFDSDGDIDLADFREFQNCHEQGLVTAGCVPGDMQGSGFVTLDDFELFYDAQTGPN